MPTNYKLIIITGDICTIIVRRIETVNPQSPNIFPLFTLTLSDRSFLFSISLFYTLLWTFILFSNSLVQSRLLLHISLPYTRTQKTIINKYFLTRQASWVWQCLIPHFFLLSVFKRKSWFRPLSQFNTQEFHDFVDSFVRHFNLQFSGKIWFLIPTLNITLCGVKPRFCLRENCKNKTNHYFPPQWIVNIYEWMLLQFNLLTRTLNFALWICPQIINISSLTISVSTHLYK